MSIAAPFVESTSRVYPPLSLSSVWRPFSVFTVFTSIGPGNGGETFRLLLAPNAAPVTATLAAPISATSTTLTLTGDGDLPATGQFMLQIDDEILHVVRRTPPGSYRVISRAMSNTVAASHAAAADAVWGDTYDMALDVVTDAVSEVTVDATVYPGWVIAFDSTQAYLAGARYPFHVESLLGVFPAGAGATGSLLDGEQPNSVCVPAGVSDDCPAALTVPARIDSDISDGDVALVRYTNAEDAILELGSRSVALQTWYAFKRVNDDDTVDVTYTDPDGNIVDGTVEDTFFSPVDNFTTVTLPGDNRTFTYGPPRYSEKGWPIAALAVRHGTRRVPYWESPDWHNYTFVYSGFGSDCTYVQVLINRNGFIWDDPSPSVDLPGPQDIDGPNATWDDGTYYFGVAWYVVLFEGANIFVGPPLNGGGTGGGGGGGTGGGGGGAGGGGTPVPVVHDDGSVDNPPDSEGGSGGGIGFPYATGLHARTDKISLPFGNPNLN